MSRRLAPGEGTPLADGLFTTGFAIAQYHTSSGRYVLFVPSGSAHLKNSDR
jgi:hypothetical protein